MGFGAGDQVRRMLEHHEKVYHQFLPGNPAIRIGRIVGDIPPISSPEIPQTKKCW